MKKGKSITLLSIVCAILAFLLVMTFVRFPIGKSKNYNSVLGAIEQDYDLAGGSAYTLTLAKDNIEEVDDIEKVLDTLKYRLNALGYQTYSVKALKSTDPAVEDYDIRIEAKAVTNEYGEPDVATLSSDISVVAAYGELEFYGGAEAKPTEEILTEEKVIKKAEYVGSSSYNNKTVYQINITFTDYGYDNIVKLINANESYYLKIMLGDTELLKGSEAISTDYFSGKSLIITTETEAGAKQAALQISSGGLKYQYEISGGESVTSPYGENAFLFSCIAVLIIMVAFIIAIYFLYKGFALITLSSYVFFIVIDLLMLIAVPGIKLSVGGVVGIALATVLTGDGFVIIAKRISEEANNGKMVRPSVKTGFRRSLMPIVNCGVLSVVLSLLLFAFTRGAVKNFAITFGIGAVISVFTTLLVARMFTVLILSINGYKPSFLNMKDTNVEGKVE